jgi:hypothetical protein
VQDTPELLALYMAPGTTYMHSRNIENDDVPKIVLADNWRLIDRTWHGGGALYLSRPGEQWMVLGFRNDANTRFVRWYVNLQDPLTRTTLGFDYLDMELDVEIDAKLTSRYWKDVDKFDELIAEGKISLDKASTLSLLGKKVAQDITGGQSFITPWLAWKPPADWGVPPIPEGWDTFGTL